MSANDEDDITNLRRGAISGFAWMSATKIVVQMFSWVGTIYVARILSPADYGLMAVAGIFIGFATMIVDLGLQRGLIQKKEVSSKEYDLVFFFGVTVSILIYSALYLLAPFVANFYNMPRIIEIIQLSAISIILSSLQGVPRAKIMRTLNFRYRSIVEMISAFLATFTVVTLATYGFGVWSLVWGILAMQLSSTIAYIPMYKKMPRIPLSFKEGSDVMKYGFKMATTDFMFYFHSQADVFIVGKILGQQMVGFYSMAKELASFPIVKLGTIFNHVAFPVFSRLQDNKQEATKMFIEIHKNLMLITMPLLIGLALVAEDLVVLLLTEKWKPIVPLIQALSLVGLLRISGMMVPPLLNSQGRVGFTIRYSMASLLILPAAFYIGSNYGLDGVAIAWIVAYPIIYLYLLFLLRNTLNLSIFELIKSSYSVYIASFVMACCVSMTHSIFLSSEIAFRLLAEIASGVVTYFMIFLVFFRKDVANIKTGFAILRNKNNATSDEPTNKLRSKKPASNDIQLEFSWYEIISSPDSWDKMVVEYEQSLFNRVALLKIHRFGHAAVRGIVIKINDQIIGLIGGLYTNTEKGCQFTGLSFPRLLHCNEASILNKLSLWLKEQNCNTYIQQSFNGGVEDCEAMPTGASVNERLEFVLEVTDDSNTRFRKLKNNHRRKLKKMKAMDLELKVITKRPAFIMALLRNKWARRKGLSYDIVSFLRSYFYYARLNKTVSAGHAGKLYGLYDNHGNILTMAYMVEDADSAFYMEGASSEQGYKIGASVRLFWDLIELYARQGKRWLNFGGVPTEAQHEEHDEHGVYLFKRGFGIEPAVRKSIVVENL